MTSDEFPAGRDEVVARLEDKDAPALLIGRVARLGADQRFTSAHEVMVALGINAPEHRQKGGGV